MRERTQPERTARRASRLDGDSPPRPPGLSRPYAALTGISTSPTVTLTMSSAATIRS